MFSGFTWETGLSEEKLFAPMTYWDADFVVALALNRDVLDFLISSQVCLAEEIHITIIVSYRNMNE